MWSYPASVPPLLIISPQHSQKLLNCIRQYSNFPSILANLWLMGRFGVIRAVSAAALLVQSLAAAGGAKPVLLELFTSEGCSSCPPADALLQKLDRDQPLEGVELIVLSEHVDYWNGGGWKDPYSSRAISERQEAYARQLGTEDIYTPQLVVDGTRELVGSNWPKAKAAILNSAERPKLPVILSLQRAGEREQLQIEVSQSGDVPRGDVYLALAADRAPARVAQGENAGRDLSHVAVLSSLKKIGSITVAKGLSVDLPFSAKSDRESTRVIVFIENPVNRQILGVAQTKR